MGDRPEVYDCALEGGVSAGVPVGEWVAGLAIMGPAEVVAVAWLGGS